MNAMTNLPDLTLPAVIETVALADLYLSPLNPRQHVDESGIELLASSLINCGLVQNLVGIKDESGKVGIVAGGRRLRALGLAVQKRPDLAHVPVLLAPDAQTAQVWAVTENVARADMEPVDEIRAYAIMEAEGQTVTEIASAFAVTENHVYRRLRLADLPDIVLDALKARKISMDQASAFTLSQDEGRIADLLAAAIRNSYSASQIRSMLTREEITDKNRKAVFVGIDTYEKAGGSITRDLFGGIVILHDAVLLDRLFTEKLAKAGKAETKKNWAWVETSEESRIETWKMALTRVPVRYMELTEEQAARADELAEMLECGSFESDEAEKAAAAELEKLEAITRQRLPISDEAKAVSGVILFVDHDGKLDSTGPMIREDATEQAVQAGVLKQAPSAQQAPASAKEKSPFSEALRSDMEAVSLHAFQHELRKRPQMALALLAFSLSDKSPTSLFGWRVDAPKNQPGEADGLRVDPALTFADRPYLREDTAEEDFADFCQMGEAALMDALVAGAVRTIHKDFGSSSFARGLFRSFTTALNVDVRSIWAPTKTAFWARVPSVYIEKVYQELRDLDDTSPDLAAFCKKKKGEKAAIMDRLFNDPEFQATLNLTNEQITAINEWMPDLTA